MAFDDEWARDYRNRLNESLFGEFSRPFGYDDFGHRGKYRTVFNTPSYGPPSLRNVYRCQCGQPESEHDDNGDAYGIPGMGCKPYAHDELREMIRSWL